MKHILKFQEMMPSNFELILGGDQHIGNSAVDLVELKKINRHIKKKKHCYFSSGGDQAEAISVTDKRFNLSVHAGREGRFARLNAQRDFFVELYEEIGDKFLYILGGNHELCFKNIFDITEDIAKMLDCIHVPGTLAKVFFPGFRLLDWHGYGSVTSYARDQATRENNEAFSVMKKLVRLPGADCDVSIMHHIHKMRIKAPNRALNIPSDKNGKLVQCYTEPTRIWIDKKKGIYRLPEEDRWFASSGSLLRGYIENESTYVEERGYEPSELGFIKIVVKKDRPVLVEKLKI